MSTTAEAIPLTWDAAAMLDAIAERVNRFRISDHAITYCNSAWAAQYDVDPAAAIGRTLDEFLSPHDMEGLHSALAQLGPDMPIRTRVRNGAAACP